MNRDETVFYDKKIAPLVGYLYGLCNEEKIPMITSFQLSPTMFANTTSHINASQWDKLRLMSLMSESWSFDEFVEKVISDAQTAGHDSKVLDALGVPRRPPGQVYRGSDEPTQTRINKKDLKRN